MEIAIGLLVIAAVIAFRAWVKSTPEGKAARAESEKGRNSWWFFWSN